MNPKIESLSASERKRLDWFRRARFGMFIHWGVYSVPASGVDLAFRGRVSHPEYRKYAETFRAERYDPDQWASLAKSAGMKYMVLTTKHVDGYCLFDTKTTDFCAPQLGAKRDLVAPYVKACRQAGLKVGLYYNLRDFSHPAYDYGPGDPRWKPYVERVHAQFEEILTRYGRIDLLWIDQASPDPLFMKAMEAKKLGKMIRRLQPEIALMRAFGEKGFGDFDVHEKQVSWHLLHGQLWELCDTFNQSWGYHWLDRDWKSVREIVYMLATCAHNGGNYLLNVGPKPDGNIPSVCVSRLREVGRWMKRNAEALYEIDLYPFANADQTWSVARKNTAYIFLKETMPFRNRSCDEYVIAGIGNRVLSAHLLGNPGPISFSQKEDHVIFSLPHKLPDPVLSVLKLKLDGKPRGLRTRWWHCGNGPLE